MPKRQRLLDVDVSARKDGVEMSTLQFLARRTQGLSDAEFVLMLRRLAAVASAIALAAEAALIHGEEL